MNTPALADLPPLIRALLDPARYGGGVPDVSLVQTDRSWVLLAGSFAYKIRKSVGLPGADLGALDPCKRSCEDELRLNQRFPATLYLDVQAIFNSPEDPQWQGGGPPIAYALKMRRFEQDARLDHVCEQGDLLPRYLHELARTVVLFHQSAALAPVQSALGHVDRVLEQVQKSLSDLMLRLPDRRVQARLRALQTWSALQHLLLEPLMQERCKTGHVRECHGDLQLENLALEGRSVLLFGCHTASDETRWIDVADELATLYVDLLAHRKPGLACWFLNEALACSGDYGSAPLLRFYGVHRVLMRANAAFAREGYTTDFKDEAMACMAIAEGLLANPRPQLCITHGEPRTTDRLLQEDAKALTLRLRLEDERDRLFEREATQPGAAGRNASLYSAELTERSYAQVLEMAGSLLQADWSVLVEGTFSKRAQRERFRSLARSEKVRFSILAPQASTPQMPSVEPLAADEPVWPKTEQATD